MMVMLCYFFVCCYGCAQDAGDEPVWRQVLCLHLDHSNLEVAQQAAAAMEE